jgi:hypothetical protein
MSTNPAKAQTRLDDLITMRKLIRPELLAKESELLPTKWPDYRFMSPLEATQHFARLYQDGLRQYVRANVDLELSETVKGVRNELPSGPQGWFTQLWQARQRADELFVPYETMVEFAFNFVSRRQRKWVPLPLQLHASPANEEAWWPMFLEFVEDRLPLHLRHVGEIAQYRMEHDRMLPAQLQFRDFMVSELSFSTKSWGDLVGEASIVKRHLPRQECLDAVPAHIRQEVCEEVDRGSADQRWDSAPYEQPDEEDFYMSCFGVQESIGHRSGPCRLCPMREACAKFSDKVAEL